jgi:hypothetical protein
MLGKTIINFTMYMITDKTQSPLLKYFLEDKLDDSKYPSAKLYGSNSNRMQNAVKNTG